MGALLFSAKGRPVVFSVSSCSATSLRPNSTSNTDVEPGHWRGPTDRRDQVARRFSECGRDGPGLLRHCRHGRDHGDHHPRLRPTLRPARRRLALVHHRPMRPGPPRRRLAARPAAWIGAAGRGRSVGLGRGAPRPARGRSHQRCRERRDPPPCPPGSVSGKAPEGGGRGGGPRRAAIARAGSPRKYTWGLSDARCGPHRSTLGPEAPGAPPGSRAAPKAFVAIERDGYMSALVGTTL